MPTPRVGRSQRVVSREIAAAEVFKVRPHGLTFEDLKDRARHLAEIHAARTWLWPALIAAMLPSDEDQKGWTVEQTKAAIAKLKGVPENLEEWFSTETPANLVSGALRVKDIADMIKLVEEARAKITKTGSHTDQFIIALDAALHDQRPGKVSKVAVLCNSLIDDQAKQKAEDERLRREVEKAAADEAAQALQEGEEIEARARRRYQFVSLEERRELDESTKAALLPPHPARVTLGHFNKQESGAIEWAQWSWNPSTGCQHDCPYCYARDIATSGRVAKAFPNRFEPTLKPRSLLTPRNMQVPREALPDLVSGTHGDTRYRNVFTGSMADIFGRWVPEEWIEAVLSESGPRRSGISSA